MNGDRSSECGDQLHRHRQSSALSFRPRQLGDGVAADAGEEGLPGILANSLMASAPPERGANAAAVVQQNGAVRPHCFLSPRDFLKALTSTRDATEDFQASPRKASRDEAQGSVVAGVELPLFQGGRRCIGKNG